MDETMQAHVENIYTHREKQVQRQQMPDYNALPCALAHRHFEWRMRCEDLRMLRRALHGQRQRILEIGAWNGWLSHHLVRMGHDLTAAEYSAHPEDSLGAMQHYEVQWRAVQMDLTDLSVFDTGFDVVIINHGLHLFPDPVAYVAGARQLLNPGGRMFLLNLTFYRNPAARKAQVDAMNSAFLAQYGMSFFLKPTRAYMDFGDKARLREQGVKLHRYPQRWKSTLKAWLSPLAPAYFYGVYDKT